MEFLAGTSGYAFKEWEGRFYPDGLPKTEQLRHFASVLPTVEINNTFYRVPKRTIVASWAAQAPDGFRFTMKASRRLTHIMKLKDPGETLHYVHRASQAFGDKLGCVFFQCPPVLRADVPRLEDFLAALPEQWPVAFEFRPPSWNDDAVYEALRGREAAWVIVDDEKRPTPEIVTAPFVYARLRRESYDDAALAAGAERLAATAAERGFVYFKHETEAPHMAVRFMERTRSG